MGLFPPISSAWGIGAWGSVPWQGENAPPPNAIASVAVIPSRVAFGSGSLGLSIASLYVVPSRVAFGNGALLQRSFISIFINGVDVTKYWLVNSLHITDPLSNSRTAQFSLYDPTGATNPQVGQDVAIYLGPLKIYGGSVEKPVGSTFQAYGSAALFSGTGGSSTKGVGGATSSLTSGGVQCTDFSNLLDRRYVGLYFDGTSPTPSFLTFMVQYIVETYFAQDGITYNPVDGDPGVNLGPTLFNWVTGRQALNTISSATGWEFSIDNNKVLRFYPSGSGTGTAAFNVGDNDGNVYAESLSVEFYRSMYRNRQGIRSTSTQTKLWEDVFSTANPGPFPNNPQPPDGIRRNFLELYGFTATPIVAVNGVPQIVAQLTQSGFVPATGFNWYIVQPDQGTGLPSYGLFQNTRQAPLSSSDVLVISYPSAVSGIYWVENAAQIAARAAIEGNSGIYEDVENTANLTDIAAIQAYAAGLLARYGNGIPYQVTYSSRSQKGLFAGQVQTIDISNPALNFTGLISQVDWQDKDGQFMDMSVTVLSGEYQGSFISFFQKLVAATQLPQPSNTAVYYWVIAPTLPGATNPGEGQQQYVTPAPGIVQNAVETLASVVINFTAANPAPCQMTFTVLQNGNTLYQVSVPQGTSGAYTVYPSPGLLKVRQGDVLTIQIFFSVLFLVVHDVSIIAYTTVLNT